MTEDAFAREVYPLMERLAFMMSRRVLHRVPAADLAQSGILAALKVLRDFAGDPPMTLVNVAARRAMVDHVRQETHRGRTPIYIPYEDALKVSADDPEPALVRAIDEERVRRRIARLKGREGLILAGILAGRTLRELGEELGLHASRVHQIQRETIALLAQDGRFA